MLNGQRLYGSSLHKIFGSLGLNGHNIVMEWKKKTLSNADDNIICQIKFATNLFDTWYRSLLQIANNKFHSGNFKQFIIERQESVWCHKSRDKSLTLNMCKVFFSLVQSIMVPRVQWMPTKADARILQN